MYYNIPLMNPTEDKNQDEDMAQNKVPSLDKSGSALKTETEVIEKLDSTKYLYNYPVQMIKNGRTRTKRHDDQKITSAHYDKSCSSMSASQDISHIHRKKKESIRNFNHRE